MGIRETRRIKGLKCVSVEQALDSVVPEDSVCLSGYSIDIHYNNQNGTLFRKLEKPFGIPYGCLVSAEISNLMFAGRCISVDDHVVGSTRVMTCCMAMGQAVGIAASMALDNGQCVADVDVQALRAELLRQRAILE
jgi:hypothetical protein